jgi:hypothetical protein
MCYLRKEVLSLLPNPKVGIPTLIDCLTAYSVYFQVSSSSGCHLLLHLQPEDTLCHNNKGPTGVSCALSLNMQDTFAYSLYFYFNFLQFSEKYYSAVGHGAGNDIKHIQMVPYLLMVQF